MKNNKIIFANAFLSKCECPCTNNLVQRGHSSAHVLRLLNFIPGNHDSSKNCRSDFCVLLLWLKPNSRSHVSWGKLLSETTTMPLDRNKEMLKNKWTLKDEASWVPKIDLCARTNFEVIFLNWGRSSREGGECDLSTKNLFVAKYFLQKKKINSSNIFPDLNRFLDHFCFLFNLNKHRPLSQVTCSSNLKLLWRNPWRRKSNANFMTF